MDVIIAVFSWCTCGHQLLSGKHLSVTKRESPLESKEAIALSYAIGDFGRAKHTFGHLDGIDGSIVELEFGKEWTIPSLQDALAKLSEEYGGVWSYLDRSVVHRPNASRDHESPPKYGEDL